MYTEKIKKDKALLEAIGERVIEHSRNELETPLKSNYSYRSQQEYIKQRGCRSVLGHACSGMPAVAKRKIRMWTGMRKVRDDWNCAIPGANMKISDAELKARIQKVAKPSASSSLVDGQPFWSLEQSKNSLSSTLRLPIKRSQVKQRLKRARLGIISFAEQKGKCGVCHAWTSQEAGPAKSDIAEFIHRAHALCPSYFENVKMDEGFPATTTEQFVWLERMRDYVIKHRTANKSLREGCANLAELEKEEAWIKASLETRLYSTKLMSFHLRLKVTVDRHFEKSYYYPEQGILYFLWDHKVASHGPF